MALGPTDPSFNPKLPVPKPPTALPGKIHIGKQPGALPDEVDPKPKKSETTSASQTDPYAYKVQGVTYYTEKNWSELPQNLFSGAGNSPSETGGIPKVSSLPETVAECSEQSEFQILELDESGGDKTDFDDRFNESELALEADLGLVNLTANDRQGPQEFASLLAGLEAFRQGHYQQAYRLDPNSFTAYKTIQA